MRVERSTFYFVAFTAVMMSLIIVTNSIAQKGVDHFTDQLPFFLTIFFKSVVGITLYCIIAELGLSKLSSQFTWKQHWKKRFTTEVIMFFIYLVLGSIFTLVLFGVPEKSRTVGVLVSFFVLLSFFGFFEVRAALKDNLKLAVALAESEKARITSQLTALRNQVNPHFLFNSLNTLSSLVFEDPHKANKFVGEFADIYRYVLELNEEPLVPLSKELQFLSSYSFLQRIRFENGFDVDIDIDESLLSKQLPPLTLQLLLENAVKHNKISPSSPLTIRVTAKNNWLVVSNNLQYRINSKESLGLGLENLKSRYQYIAHYEEPHFYIDRNSFIVEVPLLDPID